GTQLLHRHAPGPGQFSGVGADVAGALSQGRTDGVDLARVRGDLEDDGAHRFAARTYTPCMSSHSQAQRRLAGELRQSCTPARFKPSVPASAVTESSKSWKRTAALISIRGWLRLRRTRITAARRVRVAGSH